MRSNRSPNRHVPGLRLLAAKATAHAAAFDAHRVVVDCQGVRDPMLHLARMLGAGMDQPLLLLQRQRVGNLAFQIKMLLPTHLKCALQAVRRLL